MIDVPDLVNGVFEGLAAVAVLYSVRRLLKDKAVAGVSILSIAFFTAWGFWNLYYYPHLGQGASFAAGVALVLSNTLWVGLMVHYRKNKPTPALPVDRGCQPVPLCGTCQGQIIDTIGLAERNVDLLQRIAILEAQLHG